MEGIATLIAAAAVATMLYWIGRKIGKLEGYSEGLDEAVRMYEEAFAEEEAEWLRERAQREETNEE